MLKKQENTISLSTERKCQRLLYNNRKYKKILLIIVFYFENISKFNVIKLKSRGCYFLVRKKVIKQIVRFFCLVIKEIMKKIQN